MDMVEEVKSILRQQGIDVLSLRFEPHGSDVVTVHDGLIPRGSRLQNSGGHLIHAGFVVEDERDGQNGYKYITVRKRP